jgi:uncharacterized protein
MATLTDTLDMGRMHLQSGEGRAFDLDVQLDRFAFGEDHYSVDPSPVPVRLDISRTTHSGHALRIRFAATLAGPCMRCLTDAAPVIEIDAREVDQPNGGEDLDSPYVDKDEVLDLAAWARDALALGMPAQVLCRADCAGLCAECGADLNADPEHAHEKGPDPRWSKLSELKFDER